MISVLKRLSLLLPSFPIWLTRDATIIWGAQLDDTLEDTIRVTVVATGLGDDKKEEKNNDLASLLGNSSADDDESYSDVINFFKKD